MADRLHLKNIYTVYRPALWNVFGWVLHETIALFQPSSWQSKHSVTDHLGKYLFKNKPCFPSPQCEVALINRANTGKAGNFSVHFSHALTAWIYLYKYSLVRLKMLSYFSVTFQWHHIIALDKKIWIDSIYIFVENCFIIKKIWVGVGCYAVLIIFGTFLGGCLICYFLLIFHI